MLTKAGMLRQWQMKMLWLMTVLSCVTELSCWLLTSSSTISQLLKLIQHILQSSPRLVHLVELQSWMLQYFYYQIDKDLHLQLYGVSGWESWEVLSGVKIMFLYDMISLISQISYDSLHLWQIRRTEELYYSYNCVLWRQLSSAAHKFLLIRQIAWLETT